MEVSHWVQGRSPGTGSELQSFPKAVAVCRHCLHILTAEMINICKFNRIHLVILDTYVLQGVKWHLGDLSPPSQQWREWTVIKPARTGGGWCKATMTLTTVRNLSYHHQHLTPQCRQSCIGRLNHIGKWRANDSFAGYDPACQAHYDITKEQWI